MKNDKLLKNNNLKFIIIVCITLFVVQTISILFPFDYFRLHSMFLRPLTYILLTIFILVFKGGYLRPKRNIPEANESVIWSLIILVIVMVIILTIFGASINSLTINFSTILRNLWEHGLILILSAIIRYKLFEGTKEQMQPTIIFTLTLVFAYSKTNAIHMLINSDISLLIIFFELIFGPIVFSYIINIFAIKGSFLSVILISFIYGTIPYFMPVLPNLSSLELSLIINGIMVISLIILNILTDDNRKMQKSIEKRMNRYAKKSIFNLMITISLLSLVLAFFIGLFPLYPIVILSGSMSGEFERGSIVFVNRVPQNEVFNRIGAGYVVHFVNPHGVSYVHRVVEFRYDIYGQRTYITRGDANELVDPFIVPQDDILGVVNIFMPFVGYPYIFFRAILNSFL